MWDAVNRGLNAEVLECKTNTRRRWRQKILNLYPLGTCPPSCTIQDVSLSVRLLVRCAFPALSLNSRLCFARSRVSPVLWILCRPANMFPAHCLWCVCVCVLSHSLTSIHFNLAPPLLTFFSPLTLLPLSPSRLSSGRSLFFFLFTRPASSRCFLSACRQQSTLSAGVL